MPRLALGDQVADGAGDVLHRHVGIDPVLIEQIDAIDPQAPERALDGAADPLGTAVDAAVVDASVGIDVPAELGGDHHLHFGTGTSASPTSLLVAEWAVELGGVEEGHATFNRRADQRDHVVAIDLVAIAHAAESESRDL